MNYVEYVSLLLTGDEPSQPSEVLDAAEKLSINYLSHIVALHKYVQVYRDDAPEKRVELNMLTRVIDAFVASSQLLRQRYYNSALAELMVVYELLNLMRWLNRSSESFALYLSQDSRRILKEVTPARVRENLGRTRFDPIYYFLASYGSHPFYTGREYLLSVDITSNVETIDRTSLEARYYPALDAVTASIMLMTYAHAAYETGTGFGKTPLVDQDREMLGAMFAEIDAFLRACEKMMGTHRSIHTIVVDFRETFPPLLRRPGSGGGARREPRALPASTSPAASGGTTTATSASVAALLPPPVPAGAAPASFGDLAFGVDDPGAGTVTDDPRAGDDEDPFGG